MARFNPPGRIAGLAGGAVALLAVGAAAGLAAENFVAGRVRRREFATDEPYGSLHGREIEVVASDGTPIYVDIDESSSTSTALTLVFCHGYALTSDSWHFQRRDLREIGRLVFWDQRGHGRSGYGLAEDSNMRTLAGDLERVLDVVPTDSPIILVGHSMGGMTIMELAAQRPELFGGRIHGVALLATSAGGLADVPLALPGAPGRAIRRVAPTVARGLARTGATITAGWERASDLAFLVTRQYSFGSNVPDEVTEFVARMIMSTPLDVIAELLPALDLHDTEAALATLHKVETLVMVGESDRLTPPSHSELIVRSVPGAEFDVIPDTGHLIMLERYVEVDRRITDLAARVRRNLHADTTGL
ncbi:MAG: alpha/beta hydrolase [Actinomycetes bacterium]